MKLEFLINKLEEQKQKINNVEIETWLQTTYNFIEDYFGSDSSRAKDFKAIDVNFSLEKVFGLKENTIDEYKKNGIEHLNELIKYLNEVKAHNEEEELINQKKRLEIDNPSSQKKDIVKTEIKYKNQLPFGVSNELFWTILITIVSGAFILGNHFGVSKFDKEKTDYYDQVKFFQNDTSNLHKEINKKDSILKRKNLIIQNKTDSISSLNKNLNDLYLLLSKNSSK